MIFKNKNYFIIFIVLFLIVSLIFLSDQTDFARAVSWPSSYDIVSDDTETADKHASSTDEHEIYQGQTIDTFHNIFARLKIKEIPSELATNTAYQIFFNPPNYDDIWYKFKLKHDGSSQYDLRLFRSINDRVDWNSLEQNTNIELISGEYDSGTLGVKITTGVSGYVEFYTKKTYIEEPASSLNFYFSTHFGASETEADRVPNSGTSSDSLSESIDQATIDPPNLAPVEVEQGQTNVLMTRLTASTTSGTVEWTALRIDKTSSSTMQEIDVDKIKIWKDDGDQNFETNEDMLVAEAESTPFSAAGRADLTLNPTQVLTASSTDYFITYDINWFSGLDRTVGMHIEDKTYFTVSSPDNVNYENFPFIVGNSKIIPASYLSFNISGVDVNINTESVTTTVSTGGSGWIDFGNLIPNIPVVVAQKLEITTNAETGYRVTIEEDRNLTNSKTQKYITDIVGTNAVPAEWPSGSGFGYHTSDDSLETGTTDRFLIDDTYAAITSSKKEVAYHGSSTEGQAITIVYKLEVDALQQTGKYSNIISYVCTTTY